MEDNDDSPGIINFDKLIKLVSEQSPQGEAGRIFNQDDIKLEEVKELRIELSNILNLELLWPMKNIRKLILTHNLIEKIEKIDQLVHLNELDLSFNKISYIENMDKLINIEILILTGNKISTIQGIDELIKLKIFSIADNNINTWDHVVYLRKFKKLKCLNMDDNPCTLIDGYNNYLIAFLPKLKYLSYKLINDDEKNLSKDIYKLEILKIEEEEEKLEELLIKKNLSDEKYKNENAAFVDDLNDDILFIKIFENDKEGILLSKINDETKNEFKEYKNEFIEICKEIYNFGFDEYKKRQNELNEFNKSIENARQSVYDEARRSMDEITDYLNNSIIKLKSNPLIKILNNQLDNTDEINETPTDDINLENARNIIENFSKILSSTWTKLMYNEVYFHEQVEELIDLLKLNITDMINIFIEKIRNLFSNIRNADIVYRDKINKIIGLWFVTTFTSDIDIPNDINEICGDTDTLNNNLGTSHDNHMQIIDDKEDTIIRKINNWSEEIIDNLLKKEHERNRLKILEISHFLKYKKSELAEIVQRCHLHVDKTIEADLDAIFDD